MKAEEILEATGPACAPRQSPTQPLRRILVVDDDPDLRQLSVEALAGWGYQVDAAEDGAAAWDTLQRGKYDLLVTDNEMPKVTGFELLQKVHAARLALPVIMASGTLPRDKFTEYPWLKPADALIKPYTLDELLSSVRAVLHVPETAPRQLELLADPQSQPSTGGLKLL